MLKSRAENSDSSDSMFKIEAGYIQYIQTQPMSLLRTKNYFQDNSLANCYF